jgi:plasmid stabilization system protein ParE
VRDYGFTVELTIEAQDQLDQLFWNKIEHSSLDVALAAREAIEESFKQLSRNPYSCPMADADPNERKLVIPFGRKTGYIALFSIESDTLIYVTAIRHQMQDDFLR